MADMATLRGLAPLLVVLATSCSSFVLRSHWESYSYFGFEPSSEVRVLRVNCPPDTKTVRTTITTNATGGELALLLVDPAGVERHREKLVGGSRDATLTWPGLEGTWRLEVRPTDFTGSYSVELCAHDQPIEVRVNIAVDAPR
jgi:hypothetical protein